MKIDFKVLKYCITAKYHTSLFVIVLCAGQAENPHFCVLGLNATMVRVAIFKLLNTEENYY